MESLAQNVDVVYEVPQLLEVGEYQDHTLGVGPPLLDLFVAFD